MDWDERTTGSSRRRGERRSSWVWNEKEDHRRGQPNPYERHNERNDSNQAKRTMRTTEEKRHGLLLTFTLKDESESESDKKRCIAIFLDVSNIATGRIFVNETDEKDNCETLQISCLVRPPTSDLPRSLPQT